MNNNRCFVEQLSVLKESSREAVESTYGFSDFKKYMHVERNVQSELENIIDQAAESNQAELILVCGSVGDGKSHILSYFKEHKPEIMKKFKLHNDATASYYINKSSMDTLNEVLDGFSDEKIAFSNEKVILAINLGTLNNFIESEYIGRFSKLKTYVEKNKILEDRVFSGEHVEQEQFHFINFSDYHIYTLKEGKPQSEYMKKILKKVTNRVDENVFYSSYLELCGNCENKGKCPIKSNYEMLEDDVIVEELVQKIIEAVVKSKILISTRALFNFIYEIIVDKSQIDVGSVALRQYIGKMNETQYVQALLPNLLYSHPDLSPIFNALSKLDPLNIRNENVDQFIINYLNDDNVYENFEKNLKEMVLFLETIRMIDFNQAAYDSLKMELLKLFIRSYNLCGKQELFLNNDSNYEKFIAYLYHWNKGDKKQLKDLYAIVKEGALGWNGDYKENEMAIFIGKSQSSYLVKELIELKRDTHNLIEKDGKEISKFLSSMDLRFKDEVSNKVFEIEIDITLFKLLVDVCNGYKPNKKDKNLNIKFNDFVKKIEDVGSKKTQLIIKEKNRMDARKFKFEYDSEDEEFTFREI